MNFRDQLVAALFSPTGESVVAEALARGDCEVVNLHSVSPGGLRWAAPGSLGDGEPIDGSWLLGTGFVVLRTRGEQTP